MAQFGDIIARLFSGGGTRGLSGDSERVLPPGPEHGVYNDFLRRHRTEQDLVADPSWMWSTSASVLRRKSGLYAHLLDQKTDTLADFTDVLVILSQADGKRLRANKESWQERASSALTTRFLVFCDEEDYHLLFPLRPIGFRFLEDGGPEMDGHLVGLKAGEFVTGLMPNLYSGPVESSRAEIAVLVNLPGQWQGYREVGRLYSDQLQFTLGAHWLDSYHHPTLQRPLLYRLQQYADGSLVHVIHPDLQDSYRVKSHTAPDGVSVLSIVDRGNHALAHLILSVVDHDRMPSYEQVPVALGPGIMLPPGKSAEAPQGPPTGTNVTLSGSPHRTVVPLDLDERLFRLRERGALLQKVHFNKFMEGYDVYLGTDGSVQTSMADPAATFQVRGRNVTLIGHRPGLLLDGQPIPVGTAIPLRHDVYIGLGAESVEYRDLSGFAADGWPYLGEIRRSAGGASLVFGGVYRIGRDKSAKVRLPDEPENDNIVWLPGVVAGAMIRSRTGDIPKSRFYTDSIMVASLHAEIDLRDEPELCSLARHCYTFVRRGREIISLSPLDKTGGLLRTRLQSGDEILVGNCVFEINYPPPGAAMETGESLGELAKPPPLSADEIPAAAGLGELGPAPPRPHLTRVDGDSFDESASVSRGAQLALAGSSPSHFGDLIQDKKSGPRLVFDEDFQASFKRAESAPRPLLAEVASALHTDMTELHRVPLSEVELPTQGADGPAEVITEGADRVAPSAVGPTPPTLAPSAPRLDLDVELPDLSAPPPAVRLPSPPTLDPILDARPWVVREDDWQIELSRPARLVVEGWMVTGDITVTNHHRPGVALPENQSRPEQRFAPQEYFQIRVRGDRAEIHTLGAMDARLSVDGEDLLGTAATDRARMLVLRRDDLGRPDFEIGLRLVVDGELPDPRAQLLAFIDPPRVVRAMFTLGLPLRDEREITLGPVQLEAHFDGERLTLRDYLDSYRLGPGRYHPFFVRREGDGWITVPEDGEDVVLEPGDRLMAGATVYRFERA